MDIIKNIAKLSSLCGVSGCEDEVRDEIIKQIADYASCEIDPLGNIIAFKRGKTSPKNKIMLSAHMDEVGFIITHIEESGLIRFAPVGGIDSRVVVGKAVEIGEKRVYGVIGSKAVHHQEESERSEAAKLDKLFIDIGAKDKTQAEEFVCQGDRAVFHSKFIEFGEGKILGRALDDRAGCALLIEMITSEIEYDCYFAFTVQEETGCTGAVTASYAIAPDIAIIVESTTAADIAGVEADRQVCQQGKGAVISFMDKATVYDKKLYELAIATAKAAGIPAQTKSGVFGGNESRSVQVSGRGVRVMAVNLPCRYLHSPSCVLQKDDVINTSLLLKQLIGAVGGV